MGFKKYINLIIVIVFITCTAYAATTDLLRLRPATVPTSCNTGEFVSDAAGDLNFCSGGSFTKVDTTGGSSTLTVTSIDNTDSPFSLATSTDVLLVDASSGAIIVNFPTSSASGSGKTYFVKKTDSSVNAITLNRAGSDTLEGETSQVISQEGTSIEFLADGSTAYHIL